MGSGLSDTCRDAGMYSLNSFCMSGEINAGTGLWNTQQGTKRRMLSTRSATKTLWVVSSTFARYIHPPFPRWTSGLLTLLKDREAEPRFTGGPPRGDFGAGRGGFGGGFGGGGFGAGAAGRQLYVNNVGFLSHMVESQESRGVDTL